MEFNRFEYLPVMVQTRIADNLLTGLQGAELESHMDYVLSYLVVKLNAYVLGHRFADKEKTFEFKLLDGPWQRFKEKHLPTFLRWHLVPALKYRTESKTLDLSSWVAFPECTIKFPELGKPVYFQEITEKFNRPRHH